MRILLLILCLSAFSMAARAAEAPVEQIHIDENHILRGRFTEERPMKGAAQPVTMTGYFVAARGHGLIWGMEKPFPTSTIITPNGMAQDIGGLAVKLPAKNLQHLYTMISGAMAGDWKEVDNDFVVTASDDGKQWHRLLVPRPESIFQKSYSAITVSGGKFVENIVMTKLDGGSESLAFTDNVLSPGPLTPNETRVFSEVIADK
jgi:hypothetical protein